MREEMATKEEWKRLYEVAVDFRDKKSWEWMYDDMIFGVQNPENGEIGYCIVMGNIGEFFGLGVYLGSEGLAGIKRMQTDNVDEFDMINVQKCLMASFEDRQDLDKEDYKTIKELGLRFRGRKQWPQFRSYRPGFFPWYLEKDEVKFLTTALEQALIVVDKVKDAGPEKYFYKKGLYYIRVPELKGDEISWREEWIKPQIAQRVMTVDIDELTERRIKNNCKKTRSTWVLDYFSAPSPVQEKKGQRPYYPSVFMCLDLKSGMIIHSNMFPYEGREKRFVEEFIKTMEKMKTIPRDIIVVKQETYELLKTATKKFRFNIILMKRLPLLDEVKYGLFNFFRR